MKRHVHVVPVGDKWGYRTEGAGRLAKVTDKQSEAIAGGRDSAMRNRVELRIHGVDGKIRQGWSYGNDPRNIPG